jgi:hypothetical protein
MVSVDSPTAQTRGSTFVIEKVKKMARRIVKAKPAAHGTGRGKLGMVMTALAAMSAIGLFRNRSRRAGLLRGISTVGAVAATIVAATEVMAPKMYARAMARPAPRSRFTAWLAR